MRTWLITGGAGFIGSNLVRVVQAAHPDDRVVVLDALTYAGHEVSLLGCEDAGDFRFVRGDVCDEAAVRQVFDDESPDIVLHLAAESHVDRSIHGPAAFLRTNVDGTLRVLEAARGGSARVVVVSTDEVYGSLGETGAFTEDSPLRPSSPYSASKASADLLALAYHATYGLDVLVTRCSNNYGPRQLPEKLIPLMIERALAGEPLPVYGDGLNVRDWIHVDDHCEGLLLAAAVGRAGRVYNLGGESERANLVIVRAVLEALGKPASLVSFVRDRPGHDRRYAMNIACARAELGFRPRVVFEEGLRETIEWYLANRAWCAEVSGPSHRAHLERTYARRSARPSASP